MNETSAYNVQEARAEYLKHLKARVDYAWDNRKAIVMSRPETTKTDSEDKEVTIEEQIEEAKSARDQLANLADSQLLEFPDDPELPHEVIIDNPHEYTTLMQLAADKLVEEGIFTRERANEIAKNNLQHEFEHHVPGLGNKEVRIVYGIRFFQDANNPKFKGMQPFIGFEGTLYMGTYRDMISAPENLSSNDKIKSQT